MFAGDAFSDYFDVGLVDAGMVSRLYEQTATDTFVIQCAAVDVFAKRHALDAQVLFAGEHSACFGGNFWCNDDFGKLTGNGFCRGFIDDDIERDNATEG